MDIKQSRVQDPVEIQKLIILNFQEEGRCRTAEDAYLPRMAVPLFVAVVAGILMLFAAPWWLRLPLGTIAAIALAAAAQPAWRWAAACLCRREHRRSIEALQKALESGTDASCD